MKALLLSITLLLGMVALPVVGQNRIPELPDDMRENVLGLRDDQLVKTRMRGLAVEYGISSPYGLSGSFPSPYSGRVLNEERFLLKYRVPLLLKPNFKLLAGHSFDYLFMHISDEFPDESFIGSIDDLRLKANRFTLYSHYLLKPDQSFSAVVSLAYNGDYDDFVNFNNDYRIFRAILAYKQQKDANNDWAVGIYFKDGYRNTSLLPFAVWNKTFNARWGFEAIIITQFHMRYNLDKDNIFLAGYEYRSQDFRMNVDRPSGRYIYEFKWPKFNLSAQWHHRYNAFLWSTLEAGLQYNLDPRTEVDNRPLIRPDEVEVTSHGLMVKAGIFLAPPDKWLRR